MAEYQSSGHANYDIQCHVVWITKYRYKVLRGEVAERARELIRQTCEMREAQIVRGAVSADHVHMLVSAPPRLAPAKLVQYQGAVMRWSGPGSRRGMATAWSSSDPSGSGTQLPRSARTRRKDHEQKSTDRRGGQG